MQFEIEDRPEHKIVKTAPADNYNSEEAAHAFDENKTCGHIPGLTPGLDGPCELFIAASGPGRNCVLNISA
jgi:hypothetical protein